MKNISFCSIIIGNCLSNTWKYQLNSLEKNLPIAVVSQHPISLYIKWMYLSTRTTYLNFSIWPCVSLHLFSVSTVGYAAFTPRYGRHCSWRSCQAAGPAPWSCTEAVLHELSLPLQDSSSTGIINTVQKDSKSIIKECLVQGDIRGHCMHVYCYLYSRAYYICHRWFVSM